MHFFANPLHVQLEEDLTEDPLNNPPKYVRLLVEALNIVNRTPTARTTLINSVAPQLRAVVQQMMDVLQQQL